MSIEQVLRWNPEVIVTIDSNFFNAVWRDPRWQGAFFTRACHRTPTDAQLDGLLSTAEHRRA